MTLSVGTRLGPYEVTDLIGAGGMGEVYRARDTRLDRLVALKVLPGDLAADPVRRSRFEREAHTISALNHPHICTLHDVGEADGQAFLIMEHLVGETLAERLQKGPLPLGQALTLATEIADALAAAHRRGIIHRDLKPGNVMLTKTGTKLLDFGLAKLVGPDEPPAAAAPTSATWSMPLTAEHVIVGTLPYMAPEQVEGRPTDARTDLWALGTILYEMVSGRPAFAGTSAASLMSAILEHEPAPLSTLQSLTPPSLDRLVSRCLAKQPDDRWDSAHDVADELRWIAEIGTPAPNAHAVSRGRRALFGVPVAALAGAAITAGAIVWWQRSPPPTARISARLTITLPADAPLAPGGLMPLASDRPALALSPDGSHLAYVAARGGSTQIVVRDMRTGQVTPVPGTEGGHTPFFSPDGGSMAFFRDAKLRTVALAGGSAIALADAPNPWGGVWTGDVISFNRFEVDGLFQVRADGGPVMPIASLGSQGRSSGGALGLLMPEPLGSGGGFLATEGWRTVWVQKGKASKDIMAGFGARHVATGHLLYALHGKLMAVPFDPARLAVSGRSVVLADDLRTGDFGTAQYTLSSDGTLVYVPGIPQQRTSFVWVDRLGKRRPAGVPEAVHGAFDLSPDGRRLAAETIGDDNVHDIWVHDLARPAAATRLVPRTTVGRPASRHSPKWTPDGRSVAFMEVGSERRLVLAPADGRSGPVTLWSSGLDGMTPAFLTPSAFSRDALVLLAQGTSPETSQDVWSIRVAAGESGPSNGISRPQVLLRTPFAEVFAAISPDGRWMTFASDESGRYEVYVTSYPQPGRRLQVSTGGAIESSWNPNGRELVFWLPPRMLAVDVTLGAEFHAGEPRLLFEGPFIDVPGFGHGMTPDGREFLLLENRRNFEPSTTLKVITNVYDELRRVAPASTP
jgi:serine/threonine-protein kinase